MPPVSGSHPFARRGLLAAGLSMLVPGGAAAQEVPRIWMTVGGQRFAVQLADTAAARAFAGLLPLSIDMADLNRNEKHAHLPRALPARASRPGTIHAGDVMLYGSQTLVVFYLTFRSSYAYTRLGRVEEATPLAHALGDGSVRMAFSR